jgi:pyrophosphate--fructose-6-phosphate 1-phosphotransferase
MNASPLLHLRQQAVNPLPKLLEDPKNIGFEKKEATTSLDHQDQISSLFPHLFGSPLLKAVLKKQDSGSSLRVGVVLSGGQAAGGHNVICGLYEACKKIHPEAEIIGFLSGPAGVFKGKYKKLDQKLIDQFRNTGGFDLIGSGRDKIETKEQLESAGRILQELRLDGLVIVGGDDSNTNAAVLAEYCLQHHLPTKIIGVPKTIDGDLQNPWVEISFGFDTACRTYSEMIGNIARDALSAKKYTHFIKLMGRSASHIALECALHTHPNLTFISEEVTEKKWTLQDITHQIADLVMQRHDTGRSFGLILIPEGLIEAIFEMSVLIKQLNTLMAKQDFQGLSTSALQKKIQKDLDPIALETFNFLPDVIQKQLLLDRDPHGNVQVAQIETEKLFIETVKKELRDRNFSGNFSPVAHFFGYEGRAGFPTLFDSHYTYSLGVTAACLIHEGFTGYMAAIKGLVAPIENWQPIAVPLTALMHMEERKGKLKPVIEKALVDLQGQAFKTFASRRENWRLQEDYCFPGPIQFFGDAALTNQIPIILQLK